MRGLLRAGLLALAGGAGAAAGQHAMAEPSEAVVRQKEMLVRKVLADSPARARILAGQQPEAARLLESAAIAHKAAITALESKNWTSADRSLNDAMRSIGNARRLVPDPAARAAELEVRYLRSLSAVESLLESYGRRQAQQPGAVDAASPGAIERDVAMAKRLASEGRVEEARQILGKTELVLLAGLNRLLGTRTLEYSQRFESTEEEFSFELERNRSYAELVPIAVASLKPSAGAQRLIERYVRQNRSRWDDAQGDAHLRRWDAAVTKMREATVYLQRALTIAGLVLPTDATLEEDE